jgi:Protein of unknown function (DUF2628)
VAVTVYSVYEPPAESKDLIERAERLAFVKEGFSWLAFFVPLLWLLYHRMWIEFVVLLLIYVVIQLVVGPAAQAEALVGWIGLAISVLLAFEANDLREGSLERRGYRFAGTASGRDRLEAERSFFNVWLPQQVSPATGTDAMPAPRREPGMKPSLPREDGEEVIGLFPQA